MIMLPVRDAHLTGVQQQQRRKRSTAQASAEYARQKFLRRQRAAAAPVPLRALPWHQSLNRWPVEEYSTGWARDCSKCGSRLLDVEKDGWCCGQGRWRLDLLEPYPADFADFLDQNGSLTEEEKPSCQKSGRARGAPLLYAYDPTRHRLASSSTSERSCSTTLAGRGSA